MILEPVETEENKPLRLFDLLIYLLFGVGVSYLTLVVFGFLYLLLFISNQAIGWGLVAYIFMAILYPFLPGVIGGLVGGAVAKKKLGAVLGGFLGGVAALIGFVVQMERTF